MSSPRTRSCRPTERLRRPRPRTYPPLASSAATPTTLVTPPEPAPRRDLEDAARAQRQFLGGAPATAHALVRYEPFYEVGGDIFDTVTVNGRRVTIVGDVAGKGVAAALVTASLTSLFRRLARANLTPAEILASLNEAQVELGRDELFVTAVIISLDTANGEAQIANAGHLPPWLLRQGRVERIGRAAAAPLGMVAGELFPNETIPLMGDEVAVLMTDGVTDAFALPDDPCGDRVIEALLAAAPRDAKRVHSLISSALDHMKDGRAGDDLTLVTLQVAQ